MIDPAKYIISIKKVFIDDEWLFRATVKELPHVAEYAESYGEAYDLALDAIETLSEMAQEAGREFPEPLTEEEEFSGRITLRMPKSLHRKLADQAETEDVSLNHYLVTVLSYAANTANLFLNPVETELSARPYSVYMHMKEPQEILGKKFHIVFRGYPETSLIAVGEKDENESSWSTMKMQPPRVIEKSFHKKTVQ